MAHSRCRVLTPGCPPGVRQESCLQRSASFPLNTDSRPFSQEQPEGLISAGGRAWLEPRRKAEQLRVRAPSSPTQDRFYLLLSMDFVSPLLDPSQASAANNGLTEEAGAQAKEVYYTSGEKYLAKLHCKRELTIPDHVALLLPEPLSILNSP